MMIFLLKKPSLKKGSAAQAQGFSVVEVLIGLSVVAVLAVLLLAASARFGEGTKEAKCVANLRQFHMVMNLYASEHGGALPAYRLFGVVRADGTTGNGPDWRDQIAPYMQGIPKSSSPKRRTMDVCPSATFESSSNYAFYYALTADSVSGQQKMISQVQKPSEYFIFGDSIGTMRIDPLNGRKNLDFRHKGRANLLFLDGHVEGRSVTEIPDQKTSAEYKSFWLGE